MIAMQFSVRLGLHIRHWEESNETDLILAVLQNELKDAEKEKERATRENPSQFDSVRGYVLGVEYAIELIKHSLEKNNG